MENDEHMEYIIYIETKIDRIWSDEFFHNQVKDTFIIDHGLTMQDTDLEQKMTPIQVSSFVEIFADKGHQLKVARISTISTFEMQLGQTLKFQEALSVIERSAQEFKILFQKAVKDTIFSDVTVEECNSTMGNIAALLVQSTH